MSKEFDSSLYTEASDPVRYARSVKRTKRVINALYGLNVLGAHNVPRTGPGILAFVHRSYVDPWILGAATPRAVHGMAKKELRRPYYLGVDRYLAKRDVFFVDRDNFTREDLERSLGILEDEHLLAIAPEGTSKNRGHEVGEIKQGVGSIAVRHAWDTSDGHRLRFPVITPVAMTTERLEIGKAIHVIFGDAILPSEQIDISLPKRVQRLELNELVVDGMQKALDHALMWKEVLPSAGA